MVQSLPFSVIFVLLAIVECRPEKVRITIIGNITGFESLEEDRSRNYDEKWGYVKIGSDGHMFYWLYYSTHSDGYLQRPWIIWLQGGPGASGCGFGNFREIGPFDIYLESRNTTWVKQASVLFIDAPIGAGFSYAESESAYNTNFSQVIDDLMQFLRVFLKRTPEFKTRPLYIYGQSYGTKVAAHLSQRLHKAVQTGGIEVNLIGFAMGGIWISPLDMVLEYADLVYRMGLVDETGGSLIQQKVNEVKTEIDNLNWTLAAFNYYYTHGELSKWTNNVDVYDISTFDTSTSGRKSELLSKLMESLKKGQLRRVVPYSKGWSDTYDDAFYKLEDEFMKPSIDVVDELLETTDLQVIVIQGQLDLVCNYQGTMKWIQKLAWSNLTSYNSSKRKALINPADGQTEGYVKAYGKFKFYTILGAGHNIPEDKGDVAYRMLERILNNVDIGEMD